MEQTEAAHPHSPAVTWVTEGRDGFVVLRHEEGGEAWAVGFRLTRVGPTAGEWQAAEFAVHQLGEPASGLTGKSIRSLPIGELLATARRAASSQRVGMTGAKALPFVRPSDLRMAPFLTDGRGRRERADEAYAGLALEYALLVEDGDRSPSKTLAEKFGGSGGTWANRIAEARRRGLLTPVRVGEAGGALTAKALRLLGHEEP
ncbi:hypothetical protein [Micromonospora coxensis]|uniref:hypothetical protein n=1 Tax=Micromonospora coxensis TaxID=356852 RepID=UPI003427C1FE